MRRSVLLACGALLAVPGAASAASNGPIAFERSETILLQQPGGAPVALTDDEENSDPAISPDGASVAFVNNHDIWVMRADGQAQRRLTFDAKFNAQPAWSPDGARLVFVRGQGAGADLALIPAAGGSITPITSTPANGERHPAFSPDGTKIAFDRTGCDVAGAGGSCVYVMPAAGGTATNLTAEMSLPGCESQPSWRFHGSSSEPAWSPDGTTLVFTGPTICTISSLGTDLWVMDAATGAGKTNLLRDKATNDGQARFSPDGTRLVFTTRVTGQPSVVQTAAADGTGVSAYAGANALNPDWGVPTPALGSLPVERPAPAKPVVTPPIMGAPKPASSTRCVVPKLKGRTLKVAKARLLKAGCRVGRVTRRTSAKFKRGRVVSQKVKAGTRRSSGTKVALVISRGR